MGKKQADEEQEEYEFLPPDFDEDAFIHKEMVSFRTTVVLFLVGIAAALVSWALFAAVDGARVGWLIGMGVFAVGFAALRPLYRALKLDVSHYKRREWLGTGFLLFFTWLAFWMIFINPPVSDFAPPDVDVFSSPHLTEAGGSVTIDLFYADNAGVTDRFFELTGPGGAVLAETDDLVRVGGVHYRYTATNLTEGTYAVQAQAHDARGHVGGANGTFEVRAQALQVEVGDLTTLTGAVAVRAPLDPADVYAVYARVEGGGNVYLKYDDDFDSYLATANFKGWKAGENTFTVVLEEKNRFHAGTPVPGGVIESGPYTVDVTEPGDDAKSIPKSANPTKPPAVDVPGLEVPLLVAGLLGAALVLRRR